MLTAGGGIMQHKIHIVNSGNTAPQLDDEYKKGYDRLTNGFALTEFVGYKHLSRNRVWSFYGGIEFTQAFTVSRRDYNFDTMSADEAGRFDQLLGFRIGWVFPLYGRQPKEFYYY
jgi:hypothetical protein